MFHLGKYVRLPFYCPEKQNVTIVEDSVSECGVVEKVLKGTKNRDDWDESFFVGDLGILMEKVFLWKKLMPRVKPFYAVKCNNLQPVIATFAALGLGFDCASRVEMNQVLQYGVKPENIVYANPNKFVTHLQFAKENGVNLMSFDNEEELVKIKKHYDEARLLLRIEAMSDDSEYQTNKFGATVDDAKYLIKKAKELSLNLVGISYHLGRNKAVSNYAKSIAIAKELFVFAKEQADFAFSTLDIGGGFPPIDTPERQFTQIATMVSSALKEHFGQEYANVKVMAEPGRYFVREGISVLTNVIGKCAKNGKNFLYCGDGNYGVFNRVWFYQDIINPTSVFKQNGLVADKGEKQKVAIFGPSLDGCDIINRNAVLDDDVDVGDWLLWKNLGDYTPHFAFGFNGIVTQKAFYFITESNLKTLVENAENLHSLPLMHKA